MEDIKEIDKMLSLSERQLLALIRLAVTGESLRQAQDRHSSVLEVCKIDWNAIYDLATKQSVVGIVFAAIERMPHDRQPDLDLLMEWLGQTEYIKNQNEVINQGCVEVTRIFADLGYQSVILKGQSNAKVYDGLSTLRTSGDIDVWLNGSREELIRLAQEHWKTSNLQFHHIDCDIPDVPETELHFWPMTLFNYWKDKRLKRIFEEEREASFENWISIQNKNKTPKTDKTDFFNDKPETNGLETLNGDICILTPRANVIMQLAHIYHHLMFEGIGLRQLLDYYMLLRSIDDECVRNQLKKDIKDCGLTKFASAVSWVLQEAFHLETERLIVPANEKEGRFLLSEVLAAGNFGHYDERYKNKHRDSQIGNFLFITYQNFRLFKHYPSDCIWNMVYRFCQFWWRRKY